MKKFLKLLGYIFISILILILIFDVIILIKSKVFPDKVPGIIGYKPFIVMSGSMKSKIEVGDIVIVKEVDVNNLKKDDIIAFSNSEKLVTTHRIVNVINENGNICFETKGDSNNIKDEGLVYPADVEGVYKFKIAKIGSLILFLQEPLGFSLMMVCILLIGSIMFMIENRKNRNLSKEDEEYMKEFEEFKRKKEQEKLQK